MKKGVHTEVIVLKCMYINKMPGDYWDKFAQLRLLYGYFMTHPGKNCCLWGESLDNLMSGKM